MSAAESTAAEWHVAGAVLEAFFAALGSVEQLPPVEAALAAFFAALESAEQLPPAEAGLEAFAPSRVVLNATVFRHEQHPNAALSAEILFSCLVAFSVRIGRPAAGLAAGNSVDRKPGDWEGVEEDLL